VSYELLWVRFFAFTVVVEMLVAFPMLRNVEPSVARRAGAIVIANLTTHPLVFFFFARLLHDRLTLTLIAESWAVLAETVVYVLIFPKLTWTRSFRVSLFANGASYALGIITTHLHILR
jgi:hypothetical protein